MAEDAPACRLNSSWSSRLVPAAWGRSAELGRKNAPVSARAAERPLGYGQAPRSLCLRNRLAALKLPADRGF